MNPLDYFRDKATLLRRIARLEVKIEHKNRQIGGLRSHNTRMKREHDEKLIGFIASKETV